MSFTEDLIHSAAMAAAIVARFDRVPDGIAEMASGRASDGPKDGEDVLAFAIRVAIIEAQALADPEILIRSASAFVDLKTAVHRRVAFHFGGSHCYIRALPSADARDAAKNMTTKELQETYGISRSYAYRLKAEARRK
ncbi:MAG: hypothetical protein H6948_05355 [Zoogloeaceae bacterium]|nr:hypothetical protein [Zoogloeaceae bacterium]